MSDERFPPAPEGGAYRAVTDGDLRDAMALREFLVGVGVVMQLPNKHTTAAPAVVEPSAPRRPRRPRRLATIALTLSLMIAAGWAAPALIPDRSDALPPMLLGRWEALSSRYADRAMDIRDGSLFLQRGPRPSDIEPMPIQRVRVTRRNGGTAVDIEYLEAGTVQTLGLTMRREGGRVMLALRNQPELIWRRAPSSVPDRATR